MSHSILVIDDDEGVRDAFSLALDSAEIDVLTADSGEAGIEAAAGRRPDLVFLDLKMPGIDGVETLRRLKARDPDLRVHIMTAFYEEFLAPLRQAMSEGLDFEVSRKPLGAAEIRAIARGHLTGPEVMDR